MAEALSKLEESRRNFVASVSHELRSPLTCIQGYVQGIRDGTIPERDRDRYLDVVLSEAQRLTKLVSELLDLSRFESGKFPMHFESFDINELIAVEMLKFEGRIEEKHILVEINFREERLIVRADRERIRQVVTNLIDNAVKFLADRGELTVVTQQIDGKCYVTVKDNGPGISAEDLPFIFERFYKADKAHTSGLGTGLGLAIVRRILEQHGQTIRASSGGGATFTFTLDCPDK
jgi:signal transduction histidine kinase